MTFAVLLLQLALAQAPAPSLLQVPFMAQTPELCGGAAVSMVLRYWGLRDVFPQDFAPLVSESDGGIFTSVLVKAVTDRGWRALVEPASSGTGPARLRAEIDRGRPVIALIQVSPRTYHYIVIVGSTESEVVFHDPARGAFRVLDWARFNEAWAPAGFWMMVALPPAGFVAVKAPSDSPEPAAAATPETACTTLVAHAVETALAGQTAIAEQELSAAMRLCPDDPAGWREMAGLRFSEKRYADANRLATAATRLAPGDAYSWELAATSRYLLGDSVGALSAWNRIGQPKVDAINIHGAERTPLPVVTDAAGLQPRALLTPGAFLQARRRVRDLPVAASADMKFEPAAGGLASIDINIVERTALPRGRSLLALAARSAALRELRVDVAGVAGLGESAFAAWRFKTKRPRVTAGLAFPSPQWLTGVTTFSGLWEQQSYGASADAALFRETRRRAGLQVSDWSTGWLKWQAGAALDSFNAERYLSVDSALVARSPGDRAALTLSAARFLPWSDGRHFSAGGVRANLRSTADVTRAMWSSVLAYQRSSADAPLALWPGAGTGSGRTSFLRAHQLLDHGVVTGDVLGREVINATVEYTKPVRKVRAVTMAVAAFVDAARASLRRDGLAPTPLYVDAGVGLRVRLPGGLGGLRVDVAHNLGSGFGGGQRRATFSGGWIATWPQ